MAKSAKQQIAEAKAQLVYEILQANLLAAGMPKHFVDSLQREYAFAKPARNYRADYAIVGCSLLIECEGGIWKYGRHNRAEGYLEDMVKYNLAAELGYRVLRYTPQDIIKPAAAAQIVSTAENSIEFC